MQGGFIPQHNFKERHTSNPRLSRFYKPSFSKDPWESLLKQRNNYAQNADVGSTQQCSYSACPLFGGMTGQIPAVSNKPSIADLLEKTMEDPGLLSTGRDSEQDYSITDRPWH